MLNNAIYKLQNEIDANKSNSYVKVVGQFLLKHLETNPAAAEKIVAEGKTIKGSLKEMKEAARKNQSDGCGVLTDQEGFEVVLKYFGIEPAGIQPATPTAPPVPEKKSMEFDVRLEDLL